MRQERKSEKKGQSPGGHSLLKKRPRKWPIALPRVYGDVIMPSHLASSEAEDLEETKRPSENWNFFSLSYYAILSRNYSGGSSHWLWDSSINSCPL